MFVLGLCLPASAAELVDDPQISVKLPAYVEKYGALIQSMGWTPESMAADYTSYMKFHNQYR